MGAISTAVGIGAALSQLIAGSIVHQFGSSAGFLFLSGVAAAAFALLFFLMPETKNFIKGSSPAPKTSINPVQPKIRLTRKALRNRMKKVARRV
ncbi:MFS transporter [Telmatocola sphagniphila]|uniref:MFS transporter n=1 Tax=Telmatocola sphagniphila TaxID=1123043 RepID=UPI0036F1F33F